MTRQKILFICGSLNQTRMMHQIAREITDHDCLFTPFYCDGIYRWAQKRGWLDWTIIGGQNRRATENYLSENGCPIDYGGARNDYALALTCTDLLVQDNLGKIPLILVQEGMTDPENLAYHLVRLLRGAGVPRWLGSTATTGLSDAYRRFCVASPGYREHFLKKGVREEKLVVTGIPNFDNAASYRNNAFPYRGYALVATTDTRENFKWDNRRKFLERARRIAGQRPLIFKLHPNENAARSTREIRRMIPEALVFQRGETNHMVANCDVLITQYSSVAYVGLALEKEVHSYFDVNRLKQLLPLQNGGTSARRIAEVCREFL